MHIRVGAYMNTCKREKERKREREREIYIYIYVFIYIYVYRGSERTREKEKKKEDGLPTSTLLMRGPASETPRPERALQYLHVACIRI